MIYQISQQQKIAMNNQIQHLQPRTECRYSQVCRHRHLPGHTAQYWHELCNTCFAQGGNPGIKRHPKSECWYNPRSPNFRQLRAPVPVGHHHQILAQGQGQVLMLRPQLQLQQQQQQQLRLQQLQQQQLQQLQLQQQQQPQLLLLQQQARMAAHQAQNQAVAHACAGRHLANEAHRLAGFQPGAAAQVMHPGLHGFGLSANPASLGWQRLGAP